MRTKIAQFSQTQNVKVLPPNEVFYSSDHTVSDSVEL